MNNNKSSAFLSILLILLCTAINVLLNKAAVALGLPLYLDTAGTVLGTVLGGYLPGIVIAILTNFVAGLSSVNSIYFAVLNVMIAVVTYFYFKNFYGKKNIGWMAVYVVTLGFIGGGLGSLLSFYFEGDDIAVSFIRVAEFFEDTCGFSNLAARGMSLFTSDVVDKAISVFIAFVIYSVIPKNVAEKFEFKGWRQRPLSKGELKVIGGMKNRSKSINTKIVSLLIVASVAITIIVTLISITLFRQYTRDQHKIMASGVAGMVADAIDGDRVDEFLEKGKSAEGYKEIEDALYSIRNSSPDIEFIYVYKIMEDGCHVVFDLDTEDTPASQPGDVVEFDEAFSGYMDDLFAGKSIEPIISDETYGWLLTAYKPVFDSSGKCVCYAAADISMTDVSSYERDFFLKLLTVFSGFLIFVIAFGLWVVKYNIILPINSMSYIADKFEYEGVEGREKNLAMMTDLDINTGDEVENLYDAIMRSTEDNLKSLIESQRKEEKINQIQYGLIMVLADIVENRDESTGDHIKKTAAYTRIIMDAMKEKGYYVDQLTDEFFDDVVRSAPLHDIGKIEIPDAVLNKPGRLTDEEYEIMKRHTTAGMKIIEEAIKTLPDAAYLDEAKNMAAYHHEKWNGKGYPFGLVEEEIPLSARIMAVADVFDALVSERVYKKAFSFEKAMDIIREDAGTHFDPLVADAFISAADEVREVAENFSKISQERFGDKFSKNHDEANLRD